MCVCGGETGNIGREKIIVGDVIGASRFHELLEDSGSCPDQAGSWRVH